MTLRPDVVEFCNTTGSLPDVAEDYLRQSNGDLNQAVLRFFESSSSQPQNSPESGDGQNASITDTKTTSNNSVEALKHRILSACAEVDSLESIPQEGPPKQTTFAVENLDVYLIPELSPKQESDKFQLHQRCPIGRRAYP